MADGWQPYVQPYQQGVSGQFFKKGRQALIVSVTMAGGKADRSIVSYSASRIDTNVPIPTDATEIVYDSARPYLNCMTAGTVDVTLGFLRTGLIEDGWQPLQASEAGLRWPDAKLDEPVARGTRAFFIHPGKRYLKPIQLTLTTAGDGKTAIDMRSAPFALPQVLEPDGDLAGLPRPNHTRGSSSLGSSDSAQREIKAAVVADLPAVTKFYRSEMDKRGWREETKDTVIAADEVKMRFTSSDGEARMHIGRHHDLAIVQMVAKESEASLAAKARAKKEASNRFMQDALSEAQSLIAADDKRRRADMAEAAAKPVEKLAARTTQGMPIPVPDGASEVNHDASSGQLDFSSTASVKSLASFYREALKAQGWSERPSVINNPTMSVLNFSKAKKDVAFTIMQMGPKATVRASGSALKSATVQAKAADTTVAVAKASEPVLESDDDPAYPTPKQRTLRTLGTSGLPGGAPFRHELTASIPAGLDNVLGFYRSELGKRGWQEQAGEAGIKAESATLAFKTPDGPAVLKLERRNGETTVNLVARHPDAATKAGILPAKGKVRLLLGNMGDAEVAVTINGKTIKVGAGVGGPKNPSGPTMEVAPGVHRITLKPASGGTHDAKITVAANDSWGVMVGPDGRDILPIQLY
ncbi:hypothetical protein RPMA_00025 [Tardiphaga alba]|uniref:Uncharacterized protein n=1 Tax=Tardiphaga alba TaxID=340268 RepID=A0ABX8A3E2_9BRAD|nr:hypothetical protein [Tardiphaga alba]QUS37436.1 hypothetical protein RPMA_00025 [Tardiphaga alba]